MKARKQKAEADVKTVARSLKMPIEIDAKVQKMADGEDRSWSYIVVRAVKEMLDRAEKPTKP